MGSWSLASISFADIMRNRGCVWFWLGDSIGIIVAGLSGSIYGILACQLGNIVLNWSSWEFFRRLWYTSLLIGATVADIIVDIVMYSPDISYSDHVGGFITGACAGFVVMGTCKMSKWKKEIEIVSVVLFAMYFVAGMVNILIT